MKNDVKNNILLNGYLFGPKIVSDTKTNKLTQK